MASFLNRAFGGLEHFLGIHNDPNKKPQPQVRPQQPQVNFQNLKANSVRQQATQNVQQQQQQQAQPQQRPQHQFDPTKPLNPTLPQPSPFIQKLTTGGLQVPQNATHTYHDQGGNVVGWEDNTGSHLTPLGQQQQQAAAPQQPHSNPIIGVARALVPTTAKFINTVRGGIITPLVGAAESNLETGFGHDAAKKQAIQRQTYETSQQQLLGNDKGFLGVGSLYKNQADLNDTSAAHIAKKTGGTLAGGTAEILPWFIGAGEVNAGSKLAGASKVVGLGAGAAGTANAGDQLISDGHVNPAEVFRSAVIGGATAGAIHGATQLVAKGADKLIGHGLNEARQQVQNHLASNPEFRDAYTSHMATQSFKRDFANHLATNPHALEMALNQTTAHVISAIPGVAGNEAAVASVRNNPELGNLVHHLVNDDEPSIEHSLRQLLPGADEQTVHTVKQNLTGKSGMTTEPTPEAAKLQEQKAAEQAAKVQEEQQMAAAQEAEAQKVVSGEGQAPTNKPTQGAVISPEQVAGAAAHSNPVEIYRLLKESNLPDDVAIAASHDLKHITDPKEVAAYLNNHGILADSGADQAGAKGAEVAAGEQQQLAAADNVQEGTPQPDTAKTEAELAQGAPLAGNQAENPNIAQNAAPTDTHPLATHAANIDTAAEAGKTAEFKQTVQDKLDRGLPLTPEERVYVEQKTMAQQAREVAQKEKAQSQQGLAPGQQDIFGNEVPQATPDTVAPEHTTMENTAQRVTPGGEIKTIAKGAQGENLGTLQRAMVENLNKLHSSWFGVKQGLKEPIRLIDKVFENAPELGQMFKDVVVYPMNRAAAAANDEINANNKAIVDVFQGMNKKQQELAGVVLENMSKSGNLRKLKAANPNDFEAAYQAAQFGQQWFKENLAAINDMLVSVGQKPVKSLNDYLPHLNQVSKNDKFRALMESGNYNQFGQPNGTPAFFMKHREGGDNYSTNLFDAMMTYNKAAVNRKHLQPVVANLDNIATMVNGLDKMNPRTQNMILSTLQTMRKQVAPTANDLGDPTVNAVSNIVNRGLGKLSHNVLGWSVSVATKNMIPLIQAMGEHSPARVLTDFAQTIVQGVRHKADLTMVDGVRVPFLVNRAGIADMSKGAVASYKRIGDNIYESPDIFVAHTLVKNEMRRLVKEMPNASSEQIANIAGERVGKVMADRSMGMRAGIIANKNASVLTNFQTEPLNYLNHIMNDIIGNNNMGVASKAGKLAGITAAGAGGNAAFGAVMGQKPMIDPIGDAAAATNFVNQQQDAAEAKGKPLSGAEVAKLWAGKFLLNGVQRMPFSNIATDVVATADPNNKFGATAGNSQSLGGSVLGQFVGNVAGDLNSKHISELPGDVVAPLVHGGSQIRKSYHGIETYLKGQENGAPDANGNPTTKFDVKQNGANFVRSALYGKYSTPEGQAYVNGNFKTQTEKDIASGKVDPASLTPDQLNKYKTGVTDRFKNSLSPDDQRVYGLLGNSDAAKLAMKNGKVTQDQLDSMQARENQAKYKSGLPLTYVNGITEDQFQSFKDDPALQQVVIQASLQGKSKFSKANIDPASQKIMEEAAKNSWPGIGTFKPTNKMALQYVQLAKDVADHPGDQAAQFEATKKFWKGVVKTQYSDAVSGVYDSATDSSTNETSSGYGMSVKDIERLASGVTLNGKSYKLTNTDLDKMMELDNRLLMSGLIESPKFSNKVRSALGYGDAPGSKVGMGYSGGSGSGGKGKKEVIADQHSSTFITDNGSGAGSGSTNFLDLQPKAKGNPRLDLSKFKAPTGKVPRIVINL
jgi:hypothetical protein